MRFVYRGVDDLRKVMPELTEEEIKRTDFGTYDQDQFFDDLGRVTEYRTDPDMAELLVTKSLETMVWMRSKGVRFQPIYGRQAFKVDGRFKFWGGMTVESWGGGPGLVQALHTRADQEDIEVRHNARALSLLHDDEGVHGVVARIEGRTHELRSGAVVLACGGFQANSEMRARYLGPNWELAKVRGSRFNTGDGIRMALEAGAMPWGHWSG